MRVVLALLLALASSVAFAVSTVGQQQVAAQTSDRDARSGMFFLGLLRSPRWLAATAGGAAGYALQGAALGVGSVLVVAPVLVTSLLFALPLSARLARERLPGAVLRAGVLLAGSLAVFEVLAGTGGGVAHGSARGWLTVLAVVLPVSFACLVLAQRRTGAVRASLLAIVVGLLGGVLAVLTKSVVDTGAESLLSLLHSRDAYALVVVGVVGIYLQQLAFQAGNLRASLPIMIVLEPVIATLLGLTLLHEHAQPGLLRNAVLVVSAALAAAATVALAREQAHATVVPDEPERDPARPGIGMS